MFLDVLSLGTQSCSLAYASRCMCARQLGYCLAHLAYNVGNAAVKLHEMQVWQRILATCM